MLLGVKAWLTVRVAVLLVFDGVEVIALCRPVKLLLLTKLEKNVSL